MDIHDLKIFLMIAQEGSIQAMQSIHPHLLSVRSQVKQTMACAANMETSNAIPSSM